MLKSLLDLYHGIILHHDSHTVLPVGNIGDSCSDNDGLHAIVMLGHRLAGSTLVEARELVCGT